MKESGKSFIEKAMVLTLPRRAERLAAFQKRIPVGWCHHFPPVDVLYGCDAIKLGKAPDFTRQTPGTWGCRQSHLRILEMAATENWNSVLVFEDDANVNMLRGKVSALAEFLQKVPADWDFVQFGYQSRGQRIPVNPGDDSASAVFTIRGALNTHALVYNGRSAAKIYDLIWSADAKRTADGNPIRHIDQTLNLLSRRGELKRYVTSKSFVWQLRHFESDIVKLRKTP